MLSHLQGEPALAIDTESNSLYVYQEQVCLIQISIPGSDYLVDPLALDDLSGLGPFLSDPNILKVFHGADYDLAVLHRDFGFTVDNLFDTMWASRILGWPAHGLAALLATHFGVLLNKKYQRANWGLRPLPPAQLDYARLDTHYLLQLHELQARELETAGRWKQAQHRFARLTRTRSEPRDFDQNGFWRLPGVRDLSDSSRGVLREMYLFRDQQARARNRPPFKILSNKALVSLGDEKPHNLEQLRHIKGIPSWLVQRSGKQMLAAVERGERHPIAWTERPRSRNSAARSPNCRPSSECQARFEALRSWRNCKAEQRGVEPDMVLTNQILWNVANGNPRTMAALTGENLLAPWQAEEFGQDVLKVLREMA